MKKDGAGLTGECRVKKKKKQITLVNVNNTNAINVFFIQISLFSLITLLIRAPVMKVVFAALYVIKIHR